MRDLGRDVRYAIHTLAKRPLFAPTAITTIALGVGANTAIFSVVHGALLQPLPLHAPDELVTPNAITSTGFGISLSIPMSSMLFQVEAVDVAIYATVTALLLAVAASAVLIPATGAIKVEPSTVLREE